jgi:hypothetical protein
VYQNANLVGTVHSDWTPVYGGYILNTQKQMNWATDGAWAVTVNSSVTLSYAPDFSPAAAVKDRVGDFFSGLVASAGSGASCWLLPKAAYAQYRTGDRYCWQEGVIFAGTTVATGVTLYTWTRMPRTWFVGPTEITAFKVEIVFWTMGLYEYLHCLNEAKKKNVRP